MVFGVSEGDSPPIPWSRRRGLSWPHSCGRAWFGADESGHYEPVRTLPSVRAEMPYVMFDEFGRALGSGQWGVGSGSGPYRQRVMHVHDVEKRRGRDLPIPDAETWLMVPRIRVACPRCGAKPGEKVPTRDARNVGTRARCPCYSLSDSAICGERQVFLAGNGSRLPCGGAPSILRKFVKGGTSRRRFWR